MRSHYKFTYFNRKFFVLIKALHFRTYRSTKLVAVLARRLSIQALFYVGNFNFLIHTGRAYVSCRPRSALFFSKYGELAHKTRPLSPVTFSTKTARGEQGGPVKGLRHVTMSRLKK